MQTNKKVNSLSSHIEIVLDREFMLLMGFPTQQPTPIIA